MVEMIDVTEQHGRQPAGPSCRAVVVALSALMGVTAGGCMSLDLSERLAKIKGDDAQALPARTVAVWSDTVLHQPNSPGVRGFGGRIMFYGDKNDDPIKIDGSLVVYAWDDTDEAKSRKIPDRKYVYTAAQLEKHYSRSKLGHSYSVWIPWETTDGPQKKITLIARFLGRTGGEVTSKSSQVLLPGATMELYEEADDALVRAKQRFRGRAREAASEESRSGIQQVDYVREAEVPNVGDDGGAKTWPAPEPMQRAPAASPLKTSTIDVSPAFARRNFGQFEESVDLDAIDMQFDGVNNPAGVQPIEIGPSSSVPPASINVHPSEQNERHSSTDEMSGGSEPGLKPLPTGRPAANWVIPAPHPNALSSARASTDIRGASTGRPRSGAVRESVWRQAPDGQPGSLATRLSQSPLRAQTPASLLRGSDAARSPHSREEWRSRYSRTPRYPWTENSVERSESSGSGR